MPISQLELYEPTMRFVLAMNPDRFLEVGAGVGVMGASLRVYLEVCKHDVFRKENFKVKMDAIEVWPEYDSPMMQWVYDEIFWDDMREILPRFVAERRQYDVSLASQVLEHVEKSEAVDCIKQLREISGYVIVSVPLGMSVQGERRGNAYEAHSGAVWLPGDFDEADMSMMVGNNLLAVFCSG